MKRNKCAKKTQNSRSLTNATNLLVTAALLCVAFITADVALGTDNPTSMQNGPIYTNYSDQSVYSKLDYHPIGMAALYAVAHAFMNIVQPKGIFPEGALQLGAPALLGYHGMLVFAVIGVLFALSMPFVGLCFCCYRWRSHWCRCCGRCCGPCDLCCDRCDRCCDRCGDRCDQCCDPCCDQCWDHCCQCCGQCWNRCGQCWDRCGVSPDSCRQPKRKWLIMYVILIVIAVVLFLGFVYAIVSNEHMEEGFQELASNFEKSLTNVHKFLRSTDSHMNVLCITNYQELHNYVSGKLKNAGIIITDNFSKKANAASFSRLELFVNGLVEVKQNLTTMSDDTKKLRKMSSQLIEGLQRVKGELQQTLRQCSTLNLDICDDINNDVAKLGSSVEFDSLPDVTKEIDVLNENIKDSMLDDIKKGNEDFKKIPQDIQKDVDEKIPDIENSLNDGGDKLNQTYKIMNKILTKHDENLMYSTKDYLKQTSFYVKEYSIYRYSISLFISLVLLLVILCITLGLVCGICGERLGKRMGKCMGKFPDHCCNKGVGGILLMVGIAVMFLFSIVLMLIAVVYFIPGVILQRLICDSLRIDVNGNENQLLKYFDKTLKVEKSLQSDMQTVINACHANGNVFKIFKLDTMFNMSKTMNFSSVNDKLSTLSEKIKVDKIEILNAKTREQMEKLKNSEVATMPIHKFGDILGHDMTDINLVELANQLAQLIKILKLLPGTDGMIKSLEQNEKDLRMYQTTLVEPMDQLSKKIKDTAAGVEKGLKFNEVSFTVAVEKTLDEVDATREYINTKGTPEAQKLSDEFGHNITSDLTDYYYRVSNATEKDVGQCGPLSNAYNLTVGAFCDKILNPWNGFWLSVGWCLVLFIPTIILSAKLSTFYKTSNSSHPDALVQDTSSSKQEKKNSPDSPGEN